MSTLFQTLWIPTLVGLSIVLQNNFNLKLAERHGLMHTLIWNNIIGFAYCLTAALIFYFYPNSQALERMRFLQPDGLSWGFDWGYLLPALCGMAIILGLPVSIRFYGFLPTISLCIGSQLLFSLIADGVRTGTWPALTQYLGCALLILGTWLILKK